MDIAFKRPKLEDQGVIRPYLSTEKYRGCERTFANLYLWARFYGVSWAVIQNMLVFRSEIQGRYSYMYPFGSGDKRAVLDFLMEDCRLSGRPFRMYCVSEEEYADLDRMYPGLLQVEWQRDSADYVYETEKLISLSGKKYHGKKNHVNQFKAAHPDWEYEPITDDNVEECFRMALRWRETNGCNVDEEKNTEMCVCMNSLRLYKELNLKGGLIRADGEVVAFSLGEPACDDTFVVHIEKAYADIRGAYPIINQQFLEHEASGYRYVNREDDAGDEGLRQAKLSYHPAFMVEKGIVTLKEI